MTDMPNRAYSTLTIKSFDEDQRVIEGIASTPSTDRHGDIVDPMGAKFSLPMPLLWQHNHDQPVGMVETATPTPEGIPFRARIAKIANAGRLKDRVDEAWDSVKAGLVRAVSIGFSATADDVEMIDGGMLFNSFSWLELSLVTIPANEEATINIIRSIDEKDRAASGNKVASSRANPASAEAKSAPKGAKLKLVSKKEAIMPLDDKTIAEQIEAYTSALTAKNAELDDLLTKSSEEGASLADEDAERYDELEAEIAAGEQHIKRLERRQERLVATAEVVDQPHAVKNVGRTTTAARVKAPKLEKGIAFARYAKALVAGNGNLGTSLEFAKRYQETSPEVFNVVKAAVAAGTTTDPSWAGNLAEYDNMTGEFIDLLRARSFMNQIQGWYRVPFKISVPRQLTDGTGYWVPEGGYKPVSAGSTDRVTLANHKIAAISAITMELARMSTPNADSLVLNSLLNAVVKRREESLLDPALAAVANTNPASLTNGVAPVVASGTDEVALRADIRAMINPLLTANVPVGGSVLVMNENLALSIGMMRNPLGQAEFPDMGINGGSLAGIPVVTSQYAPAGQITLINPTQVMLAEDDSIMLDSSDQATLVMDDAPDAVVDPKPMVSMWQTNQIALRAEQMITWQKARDTGVQLITGAAYA